MFQNLLTYKQKTFHSQLNKQLSKMLGKILTLLAIFHQTNSLNAPISGSFSNEGHIILQNHLAHLVLDIRLERLEESIHTLEKSFKEFNVSEQRLKEKLPEIELVNIIIGSEVENIRKDFHDIKAFFATNDKPSNNQHQTTTERPTLLNTNNDQQQKGTIIIGNTINPGEDNNSNANQTLRKKRTTTLKSLDNNIQNTPINDNQTDESDKEVNTETTNLVTEMTTILMNETSTMESEDTHEITDKTTDYIDQIDTSNMQSNPHQITTESTVQETVIPETNTERYMPDTKIPTNTPSISTETKDIENLSTDTTEMLYFQLNQLL